MKRIIDALVLALLDGEWDRDALEIRASAAIGATRAQLAPFVDAIVTQHPATPDEAALRELVDLLAAPERDEHSLFQVVRALRAEAAADERPLVRRWHMPPLAGFDPSLFAPLVPPLDTEAEAAALLGLSASDVVFLAGPHNRARGRPPPHLHYRYRWIAKASGGHRLVEAPKQRLKAAQRALLDRVLALVPAHDAAHGFVPGRSARTFASCHAGERVVVRIDLEDFFASVGEARVRAIFEALGYPRAVARLFSSIACHRTPPAVLRERTRGVDVARAFREHKRFDRPHLPQGAPSSPALANVAAYGLDVRMSALARRFDARYSRYADDLALSGDATLARGVAKLLPLATRIANDEGFAVRFDKTRVMRSGARQQLAGLVVNQWPDVSRERYDLLRARLFAVARGAVPDEPEQRARLAAELRGHVAWQSSRPHRASKLAALLDRATAALMRA